jgi:hypothetical protein
MRSPYRQLYLFNQGRSKIRNVGAHSRGLAVDIVFKDKQNNWTWNNEMPWKTFADIVVKHELTSGFYFKSIHDAPHVESPIYAKEVV